MESESMEYRSLGNSGLKVSVLGFGNMVSGWTEGTEQWSFECIEKCVQAGINFFDTAEFYGNGVSETVLGKNIIQGGWDKDDLVVTTKFHPTCGGRQGNSRRSLRMRMRNSLRRMQMDSVDVAYLHRFDPTVTLEEQVRTMNEFIDNEQAYYWGTSEFNPQQLMECHQICEKYGLVPPIVEQCQYNMFWRENFERDYAPLYDEYGMGTTTWSPLASGLLTGKYNEGVAPDDSRFANAPFAVYDMFWKMMMVDRRESTLRALKGLADLSNELGCSQPQLGIAWVIKNPDVSTCLLGASKPQQLDETLKTVEVMKQLTPEVLSRIEDLLGNRPEPSMKWRNFSLNPPRR